MARPRTISDETRAAILEDYQAGVGVRAMARKHGVSDGSVRKICTGAKVQDPEIKAQRERARELTANANTSRVEQMATLRKQLALDLIQDAAKLRERAQSPMIYAGAFGNQYKLPLPTPRDQRDLYAALSTAVGKHVELIRVDHDPHADGKSLIADLVGSLRAAWEGAPGPEPAEVDEA